MSLQEETIKEETLQEKCVTKFQAICNTLDDIIGIKKFNHTTLYKLHVSHPTNKSGGELCINSNNRVTVESFFETINSMVNIKYYSYREQFGNKCLQYSYNFEKILGINDAEFISNYTTAFINGVKKRKKNIFTHYEYHNNDFLENDEYAEELQNREIKTILDAYCVYYAIENMRERKRDLDDTE